MEKIIVYFFFVMLKSDHMKQDMTRSGLQDMSCALLPNLSKINYRFNNALNNI